MLKNSGRYKKAIAASAMLMATSTAMGASESSATDWQYGLSIYAWLPSVSGDLNYSTPGSGSGIEVDPDQILDDLQMVFMGSFEARKGSWSGFTDVIYLDLGGDKSKSVSVPNGTTLTLFDASMDFTAWVWTLGGSYTTWRNQKSHLDLLAGARLLSLDTELRLTGGGPLQNDRTLSESDNLWDGIIGAKGSFALNERWFLPYYVDVGTGDTELTWQAEAGIGYAYHWGQVTLKYRYLAYDQGSDELLQDIAFGGAQLGVGFRF
jgi:hypothetical protein